MSIHPGVWARMSPEDQRVAAYLGDLEAGEHWKVQRVAELTGLDARALGNHVEGERGWEPHDSGYLHQVIVSARILLEA